MVGERSDAAFAQHFADGTFYRSARLFIDYSKHVFNWLSGRVFGVPASEPLRNRVHALYSPVPVGCDHSVPDAGEDYTALAKTYPTPPASAGIVFDGDEGRLSEAAFLRDFGGDLPTARARALYAVQQPFHKALLTGKTRHAAWRSKPSFYAVSTEDRTIDPDLERFMAKRMGATTIELKSSHLSLISHPREISNLILRAAGHA